MRKSPNPKKSSSKSIKSISGSALQKRNTNGYRPNSDRSSDCSSPPLGGSSIQNKKHR